MKVFISWSGKRSQFIAETLRDWLPNVIQSLEPFISSQDIHKGTRGNVIISQNLEEANVGLICLTPENVRAPWILFEAGALSKLLSAYVCSYLWELEPSNIEPPLGQFQHTKHSKGEIRALLVSINSQLPKERILSSTLLDNSFRIWWPELEDKLKNIPAQPADEPAPKERTPESKLDELLELVRTSLVPATNGPPLPSNWAPDDIVLYEALRLIKFTHRISGYSHEFKKYIIENGLATESPEDYYHISDLGIELLGKLRLKPSVRHRIRSDGSI